MKYKILCIALVASFSLSSIADEYKDIDDTIKHFNDRQAQNNFLFRTSQIIMGAIGIRGAGTATEIYAWAGGEALTNIKELSEKDTPEIMQTVFNSVVYASYYNDSKKFLQMMSVQDDIQRAKLVMDEISSLEILLS